TKGSKRRPITVKLGVINLFGIGLAIVVLAGLVYVLDSGPLVDWIFQNRYSKIDEILFVALLILLAITLLSIRRALTLPANREFAEDSPRNVLVSSGLEQRFWRDLVVLGMMLGAAAILVLLFDTGGLVEWLARHKSTKIDEIIVAAVVLLIGL